MHACTAVGVRLVIELVAACVTVRSVQTSRHRRAHVVPCDVVARGRRDVTLEHCDAIRCDHTISDTVTNVFTPEFNNLACYAKRSRYDAYLTCNIRSS